MPVQQVEGRVLEIVGPRRIDVEFPDDRRPPRYHWLHVLDERGALLGEVTAWKDCDSSWMWKDQKKGWMRCWGSSQDLQPGLRVVDTGRINRRARRFDSVLIWVGEFLKKRGWPYSREKGKKVEPKPPLKDLRLSKTLNEILDVVVTEMGYTVAMLATYEHPELVLRVIRNRLGIEWAWEWAEDWTELQALGQVVSFENEDHADNIAITIVKRALAGERKAYGITKELWDLWKVVYVDPRDRWLLWLYQHMVGVRTIVTMPFCAPDESGKPQLIANMYVGSRKRRLAKRDLATLHAFVSQASLAIENERLLHIAEKRALEAETLAGMADFGSKMVHRMINYVSFSRLQIADFLDSCELERERDKKALLKALASLQDAHETIEQMRRPFRPVNRQPTDLDECVQEALGIASLPASVAVEIDESLPGLPEVIADRSLSEVFLVLINNAAQAMDDVGTITIYGQVSGQLEIQVSVSDTGPGISPEVIQDLFKLFSPAKQKPGGAGLGLWWAKNYLGRCGGRIWLEESTDQGTTFALRLPIALPGDQES